MARPSGLVPEQEKSIEIHSPEYKRSKKEEEDVHIPEESGASSSSAYQPPREEITPQLPIAEEHTSEEESTTELLVFHSTITSEFLENPRWLSRACQCEALHQAAHD